MGARLAALVTVRYHTLLLYTFHRDFLTSLINRRLELILMKALFGFSFFVGFSHREKPMLYQWLELLGDSSKAS